MTADMALLIIMPLPDADRGDMAPVFAWWRCVDGKCIQHGESADVLAATGIAPEHDPGKVIALLPATMAAVHSHHFGDMTAPQAQAAARLAALEQSIGKAEDLHVASALTGSDETGHEVYTAVAARAALQSMIAQCQAIRLDPDHIHPAALVVADNDSAPFRFTLAGHSFLRAPNIAAEDDPALREMLIGDGDCAPVADADVTAALAALTRRALPDLRQGIFARKTEHVHLAPAEKRFVYGLVAALLIITLLIPGIRLWRYQSARDAVISEMLAKAQPLLPQANDLDSAEQQVNAALRARGAGPQIFTAPVSALFASVQEQGNVTLNDLSYASDGTVTALITASDQAVMDRLGTSLSQKGYYASYRAANAPAATGAPAVYTLTVHS